MCGIVGYIGNKPAVIILLEGLKRLEYRGYDSAGIAILENGNLIIRKKKGKIKILAKLIKGERFNTNTGIAHTRWATHGGVTDINAHPHLDCKKKIAVVHNGIIENWEELRKFLRDNGHKFRSQTDSEVIAHLIEHFINDSLIDAVHNALKLIEGTYGVCVISSLYPDEIIAARHGSPLLIGIGKDHKEHFIGSDAAAFLKHTNKQIVLEDKQIARITANKISIYKMDGQGKKVVKPKVEKINWTLQQLEKGNHPHFMHKEIFEQPDSLLDAMRGRNKDGKIQLGGVMDRKKELLEAKSIVLTACGTAWHAGLIGKIYFEEIAGIPSTRVEYASELANQEKPGLGRGTVGIAISQSGETKDTDLAVQRMQKMGVPVFGICNVIGSTIARRVGAGVYTHAGPEIGVASTKAFTSQVLVLAMLATMIGREKGVISQKWMDKFARSMELIPEKVKQILKNEDQIKKLACQFSRKRNFLYLGRGINFPTALEGALKLKEISYIHAEGQPAGEMKHGPIALIDKSMPVVIIAFKNDHLYKKICGNIEEIKARSGIVIAIAEEGDRAIKKLADYVIYIPHTSYYLWPILAVIPLQLLAYHIAVRRRCNVDQPRNLAKSVTVE